VTPALIVKQEGANTTGVGSVRHSARVAHVEQQHDRRSFAALFQAVRDAVWSEDSQAFAFLCVNTCDDCAQKQLIVCQQCNAISKARCILPCFYPSFYSCCLLLCAVLQYNAVIVFVSTHAAAKTTETVAAVAVTNR
jgi:hypothetical protein